MTLIDFESKNNGVSILFTFIAVSLLLMAFWTPSVFAQTSSSVPSSLSATSVSSTKITNYSPHTLTCTFTCIATVSGTATLSNGKPASKVLIYVLVTDINRKGHIENVHKVTTTAQGTWTFTDRKELVRAGNFTFFASANTAGNQAVSNIIIFNVT